MANFYKNIDEILDKIDIFNFLRGIALLCVLGIHTVCTIQPVYPDIHYSRVFNTPAWMSMWIFFFLSGYLLGKGFYKNKYQINWPGIKEFYVSRLIRIVPMYLFFLFILFLFYNPMWFITNPIEILRLFTFTYNGNPGIIGVGATWFVSCIVQLYILCPLMYKYVFSKLDNKKSVFKLMALLMVIDISYRLIMNWLKLPYFNYCLTFSLANIDLFFGGMLLNAITLNSEDNKFKRVFRRVSLIILFAIIFMYMHKIIRNWPYRNFGPTIIIILMSAIIYSFDYCKRSLPSALTLGNIYKKPLRFIEYLGIISFPFYLWHSNIIEISMKILKDGNFPFKISDSHLYFCTFILMFVLSFILSVIMHYILEKPCNKFRYSLLQKTDNSNK